MYRMVFTQIFCRVTLIVVLVVMTSCASYRVVEIETLQPAKQYVEKNKRIALLDRKIRVENSPLVFQDTISEQNLSQQFNNGINYIFSEMGWDTVVSIVSEKTIRLSRIGIPEELSFEKVNQYCEDLKVDYLLSTEILFYTYKKNRVECKRYMRLYQYCNPFSIDSVLLSDTLFMMEDIDPEVLFSELKAVTWDQGAEYGRRLIPNWEKSERRVYNRGKVLRVGDAYWQSGNIEQASKIWAGAMELHNNIAIKAGINLAWFYENTGDYDSAFHYLDQSRELLKKSGKQNDLTVYVQNYLELLKKRLEQKEILNEQLLSD